MEGISFSVRQFIKQELKEVNCLSAELKQELVMPENIKCNGQLNGEYVLDLNSPEFNLQNIATEFPVDSEQSEHSSITRYEEIKSRISFEQNIIKSDNMEAKMHKAKNNANEFELLRCTNIKNECLNKENISYNLNDDKMEIMPSKNIKTETNFAIKEERTDFENTQIYSVQPNFDTLQNLNVRFSVSSKHSDDKSAMKNKALKRKSSLITKTNASKFVNQENTRELINECSTLPKKCTSGYECPYCGYKCKYEAIFQDHMSSHQNTYAYRCNKCDFQCRLKNSYQLHINAGHDENKMLQCSKCKYKNTCSTQFKLHIVESGHKIKCIECDLEFDSELGMKRHLLDHEIKMFECPECKKVMKYNQHKRHMLTHTKPFLCKVCGYRAGSPKRMQDHMLTHTNEKSYECEVCHKNFSLERNLKRHLPSHQNRASRQLFECVVCKRSYTLKQTLKQHYKKSNHGENLLTLEML